MLTLLHTYRRLRLLHDGILVRWLGQAIRGVVGSELKPRVCRHALELQDTTWRYCKGCPHQKGCAYGETLEAAPEVEDSLFRGQEDGFRPLVIHASFLTVEVPKIIGQPRSLAPYELPARKGTEIPIRVTFIGETARQHAPAFWESLGEAGVNPQRGLGERRIPFEVLPMRDDTASCIELPMELSSASPMIPSVRLELLSPLLMKWERDPATRQWRRPDFGELLRACLRVLGGLHTLYDQRLKADFAGLKQAAQQVPTLNSEWRDYYQARHSNRKAHLGMVHGLLGWAEFGPLPEELVKWLRWGGILGVGSHRVAGAGQWRVSSKG